MQRKPPDLIEMGRVAGSYGVRGWVRIEAPEAALADCSSWWIGGTEYAVEQTKPHSGTLLAKLEGLSTPEAARKLKAEKVLVARQAMPEPEPGHYYLADLVGLEVVNGQGETLGVVRQWMHNGAQDVMEVTGKRTHLVPWIPSVVQSVDLEKRRIQVEWGADW